METEKTGMKKGGFIQRIQDCVGTTPNTQTLQFRVRPSPICSSPATVETKDDPKQRTCPVISLIPCAQTRAHLVQWISPEGNTIFQGAHVCRGINVSLRSLRFGPQGTMPSLCPFFLSVGGGSAFSI